MKRDITALYLFADAFCKAADQYFHHQCLLTKVAHKPTRVPELSTGEILTIV